MNKLLSRFKLTELMLITLVATLGLASKVLLVPLIHMVTGPLYIPGGALAGGFYMLWLVIGAGCVSKSGTATLIAILQGIMVMIMGSFGSHGGVSIISYALPGIALDIFLLFFKGRCSTLLPCFLGCILANVTGTFMSNLLFFRLPMIPLLFTLSLGAISGGIGGIMAYHIIQRLRQVALIGEGQDSEEIL